jgi:hypothetical protein
VRIQEEFGTVEDDQIEAIEDQMERDS